MRFVIGSIGSGKAASQVPVPLEAWSDVNKRMPNLSADNSCVLWVCFRFRACLFGAVEADGPRPRRLMSDELLCRRVLGPARR